MKNVKMSFHLFLICLYMYQREKVKTKSDTKSNQVHLRAFFSPLMLAIEPRVSCLPSMYLSLSHTSSPRVLMVFRALSISSL